MTQSEMRLAIRRDKVLHPDHQYHPKAYNRDVMAVASVNIRVGDWAAYIGAVAGKKHDIEWIEVRNQGTKLPRVVAEAMFPHEAASYEWRA